jgi:hypothetical protein
MLRITVRETDLEQRLILEGKLTERSISELESAWRLARATRGSRACVIDLQNTTLIEQTAEALLVEMKRDGASFIACGICTRFRLGQLGIRCQ